jgi:DNA repair exonuclease SbcCD ATPase subunit
LLKDYRDWLESELKLLGNASHHAYSFGQANMAKRALERLDAELTRTLYVPLDRAEARRVLTALEAWEQQTTSLPAELQKLREALKTALVEVGESSDL